MMSDVQKRMRIVEAYKKRKSLRGTAERVGVNVKTVKKWVDRFAKYGKKGLTDKRFKAPVKKSKGRSR
jgi:transposase